MSDNPRADRRTATSRCVLIDDISLSEMSAIPVRTLRHWRLLRRGPAFTKCGKLVRYKLADVENWLAANTVTTTDRQR